MSTSLRNLLFSVCVCVALIQQYGCRKVADNTQPPAVDTTTKPGNASRNSIDSIIGTYYGSSTSWGTEHINGTQHDFQRQWPDTLVVTKDNATSVSVYSNKIGGQNFLYDSLNTMYKGEVVLDARKEWYLTLHSTTDSVWYSFSNVGSNDGVNNSFVGKK